MFKYHEEHGGVSQDSESIAWGGGIPIDYKTAKEILANPGEFEQRFEVKEKTVKGKTIKTVEAKNVRQDSK